MLLKNHRSEMCIRDSVYQGDDTDFGLLCRYDLVDFETGESLGIFESEPSQLELL